LPQALKVSFGGGTNNGGCRFSRSRFNFFLYLFFHFFMNGSSEDMTIVLETLAGFLLGNHRLVLIWSLILAGKSRGWDSRG
jgi:K(+)-stimulated pyrophosphate-energized sodium pump